MARKKENNLFKELSRSLRDAAAFEKGELLDLRVTKLPPPPRRLRPREIRRIRQALNASQVLFATYLNVSPNTIRSWEQGTRRPHGTDLKLLAIAKKDPATLLRG